MRELITRYLNDGKPDLVEASVARYGGGAESTWDGSFHLAAAKKPKV